MYLILHVSEIVKIRRYQFDREVCHLLQAGSNVPGEATLAIIDTLR
jgi:hypothetical protein